MLTLSLNGAWELRRGDDTGDIIPALVPGCVHEDLLRAGVITDPNWRDDELKAQWVGKTAWRYARSFEIADDLLDADHVLLRAEGLDTLAEVVVNGQLVASVDNQHITWEWDVKSYLHVGENRIEICFTPPDAFLQLQSLIHPLSAWNEFYGYKHRGWLRKAHSNFGWDWSPVLVSCGIWRPISLLAFSGARLADVAVRQDHSVVGLVSVDVNIALETIHPTSAIARIALSFNGENIAHADIQYTELESKGTASLQVHQPQLWWPNGLGDHPLYTLTVDLLDASGARLDLWQRRIGLRTLVVRHQPDTWGESFEFVCNGVPFFAKGSNWAPPLPYPSWPHGDEWKTLLYDAAAVHMNMMRMWGGAYFAPDVFFDLCDELGLTIWQDFLFACGPYPGFDTHFQQSIEREARDNVRRLRHHPSIALWCGNNELEPTFVGPEWQDEKMSLQDYDKIFNDILPGVVSELAPQTSYWPASPSNPLRNRNDASWPFPADAGDTHIWEIWFSDAPFENYRNYLNRFISEFGFQSFPHPKTIAGYTLADERQFNSPVMEHHQRSQPGNMQILKFIQLWFRFPERRNDYFLLSQLLQAMCVKIGVEHWRRNMARTMGTLYWQLNDCWPCPSWSSIDFAGRWKVLHYFVARCYAPLMVSGLENAADGTVTVHLSNDLRRTVHGQLRCSATDLSGTILQQQAWPVTLTGGTSSEVGVVSVQANLQQFGTAGVLVWLDFSEDDSNDATSSHNMVLFDRPKNFELRPSNLRFEVLPYDDTSFVVYVTSETPALWVWLDTPDIETRISDNYRCLRPGDDWHVIATPDRRLSALEFASHLVLRDLYSTYLLIEEP